MRYGGIDGALHGKGPDLATVYGDERLGRETHEPVFHPAAVTGLRAQEDVAQPEIGVHRHLAGEVDKIAVAGHDVTLHDVDAPRVPAPVGSVHAPFRRRAVGRRVAGNVVQVWKGIHHLASVDMGGLLDDGLCHVITDDKDKGFVFGGEPVDSFSRLFLGIDSHNFVCCGTRAGHPSSDGLQN